MKIHQGIRNVVLAAILGAYGMSASAQVAEFESTAGGTPNHPIGSAQRLTITGDPLVGKGGVTVRGVIGTTTGTMLLDADFYSFFGREGDVVTINIDGGVKASGGGRSVDTVLTLFRPMTDAGEYLWKDWINDLPATDPNAVDRPGSISRFDARLDNVRLDATGIWTVGVSGSPARLLNGGIFSDTRLGAMSNGAYTLIISGVSLPAIQISIDVKPGSGETAPINPKSKGTIPVALLGSAAFRVSDVDLESLRFGATGGEKSLRKCIPADRDVNADGYPDLVCHFGTELMGVDEEHVRGYLKGMLKDGTAFEGNGNLKVLPVKKDQD